MFRNKMGKYMHFCRLVKDMGLPRKDHKGKTRKKYSERMQLELQYKGFLTKKGVRIVLGDTNLDVFLLKQSVFHKQARQLLCVTLTLICYYERLVSWTIFLGNEDICINKA